MKKLLFLICVLVAGVSGAWATTNITWKQMWGNDNKIAVKIIAVHTPGTNDISYSMSSFNLYLRSDGAANTTSNYLIISETKLDHSNTTIATDNVLAISSDNPTATSNDVSMTFNFDEAVNLLGGTTYYLYFTANNVPSEDSYTLATERITLSNATNYSYGMWWNSTKQTAYAPKYSTTLTTDDDLTPEQYHSIISDYMSNNLVETNYALAGVVCYPSLTSDGYLNLKTTLESIEAGNYTLVNYNNLISNYEAYLNESEVTYPVVGKFYKLYHINRKRYLHAKSPDNSTELTVETDNTVADAIFYIPVAKTFASYLNGYYIVSNKIYNLPGGYSTFTIQHQTDYPFGYVTLYSGNRYFYAYTDNNVYNDGTSLATDKMWQITEVTSLPVTITTADYATLYAPVALEVPAGVTAYTATDQGTYLSLTAIEEVAGKTIIPANTGVILYKDVAEATTVYFDITTGGSASSELAGTTAAISRPANSYILATGDAGVGFYKDGATVIPGFKAYLAGASVKGFLGFNFDETVIQETKSEKKVLKGTVYDLNGRPVTNPARGIYVMDGETIFIP